MYKEVEIKTVKDLLELIHLDLIHTTDLSKMKITWQEPLDEQWETIEARGVVVTDTSMEFYG